MNQAYYSNSVKNFLFESTNAICGKLNKGATQHSQLWTIQLTSWESAIEILKNNLSKVCVEHFDAENWGILLEYEIPRLLSRIDVVLLAYPTSEAHLA